jgi:diguanylate cyclase (GGDEF)-like protein
MPTLDVRTVIIGYTISNAVCAGVMYLLWRQTRSRFPGISLWLADFLMQFTALTLVLLRVAWPEASVFFGNGLLIGGTILLFIGLEQFVGKPGPQIQNALLLAAFLAVQVYFYFAAPSLNARNINISVSLLVICGQAAWLMLYRTSRDLRPITSSTGWILAGFCLASVIRIFVDLVLPAANDFFKENLYDTLVLLAYQMLFVALTFTLVLMVTRRLFLEREKELSIRNQVEKVLRLRLTLWEYSGTHTVEELMRKTLDEIEGILQSPIGFYHFVGDDQQSLSLQAWSTRTSAEFCTAEGSGMHYPLDRAGVWADSVRQRKTIIHNDYAALSGRKGMPEGHARVFRELIVPTLRAGRVVSVLGIGNKPSDYDKQDAELLFDIADIVWVIIERKRSEEEIQRLQGQLQEMAIRDPLTGLYNRHYLGETLKRELARAAREKYPVGFIMIDIDHFKEVNDSLGHAAGDAMLQDFGVQLLRNSRESDFLYRYGGEEFLAILPKAKAEVAFEVAEKWRKIFLNSTVLLAAKGIRASISCGIAAYPKHGDTAADLLAGADKALYQAKAEGRNRSVVWTGPIK